jgi:hypothetical protein
MESLFSQFLAALPFFSSGLGVLTIATLATSLFLIWNWRLALLGLLGIQIGVAALVVPTQGFPIQPAAVQMMVMALCVLLLGASAQSLRAPHAHPPPGSFLIRCMVVALLLVSWGLFDLQLSLPVITPIVSKLFVWLALCAVIILSLSDAPLFAGIALLLWCIPVQVIVELAVPGQSLYVLIGMMEIILALACSYLVLVDLAPIPPTPAITTDITFPESQPAIRRLLPERGRSGANTPALPAPRSAPASESAPDRPLIARGSS